MHDDIHITGAYIIIAHGGMHITRTFTRLMHGLEQAIKKTSTQTDTNRAGRRTKYDPPSNGSPRARGRLGREMN